MISFNLARQERMHLWTTLLVLYCAASFLHFAHNATYIDDYPNLPDWLTAPGVWLVWLGETAIGVVGYLLVRTRFVASGLIVSAIYACFGFDGLAHYALAPIGEHSPMMNFTIWLEVVAAFALLVTTLFAGNGRRADFVGR